MAIRVTVDTAACCGNGMCAALAPDVFSLDERGDLVLLRDEVPESEADAVEDARVCCPVSAISCHWAG